MYSYDAIARIESRRARRSLGTIALGSGYSRMSEALAAGRKFMLESSWNPAMTIVTVVISEVSGESSTEVHRMNYHVKDMPL